jgi:hypothetical protein
MHTTVVSAEFSMRSESIVIPNGMEFYSYYPRYIYVDVFDVLFFNQKGAELFLVFFLGNCLKQNLFIYIYIYIYYI